LANAATVLSEKEGGNAGERGEGLEMIERIRQDYSLDESAVLAKLNPQIRGVSLVDVKRWADAGQLQFREMDGQRRYFQREPSNLFRFCPEAIGRRIKPPTESRGFVLNNHLSKVIAEAKRTGADHVQPVRHRVKFTVTVSPGVRGYREGSVIKAWLPYPQEYGQRQTDVKLISAAPARPQPLITPNGAIHRTLYFERRVEDPARPATFEAVFEFTSRAFYPKLDDAKVEPTPADLPKHFLAERPPHIRFSPELKETVAQVVGDETNALAKARKIFHWVDANIRYNAEEEYCIIPSFSEHGLKRRRGDCGIQGTLFVTMCRAAGVPARWQSGWQTKPSGQHNMHDWTEIYVAPWGWLPCDPSYGLQKSDDPAVREFYFGHQDSYRLIVNLDYGGVLAPPKKSLRSEPADFQRGEVELDGRNLYYNEFDYDFSITHLTR
jgi:transglutaminase-like putative cysteine protease